MILVTVIQTENREICGYMLRNALFAAMAATALNACSQKPAGSGLTRSVEVTNLSTTSFADSLKSTSGHIVLDVRTPEEFRSGYLAGAVNMNINDPDFAQQIARLDTAQPVYVYCLAGSRSARAADLLKDLGFPAVYNMEGGISRWRGENREIIMPEGEAEKGMKKAEFDKMVMAAGDTLVLVDFWAKWCAPCKMITAYLPDLEKEFGGKLKIVKVSYDDNTALVRQLGLDNVPYLFIYKNGKELWKNSGFAEKEAVLKALKGL